MWLVSTVKKHAALEAAKVEEEYRGENKYECMVPEWVLDKGLRVMPTEFARLSKD